MSDESYDERERLQHLAQIDQRRTQLVEQISKTCGGLFRGFTEEGFNREEAFDLVAIYLEQTVHVYLDGDEEVI